MSKPLELQLHKQAMLSGVVLLLRPIWALTLGGEAEALVFAQLLFRAGGFHGEEEHSIRLSYTRLQRQLPFFTRRWIIEVVRRLETVGAIEVTRGDRVNVFRVPGSFDVETNSTPQNSAKLSVFPELARVIGLIDAVVLQQVHIRQVGFDGSLWVIRSFNQWHAEVFMFLGLATVKRVFSRLLKRHLLLVKPYQTETGRVNSYRVNYIGVAAALGIAVPEVLMPKGNNANDWTNPLYPK